MSPDLKDSLEAHAKNKLRSLTKEINERLRVSLTASGPTAQAMLAREAFVVRDVVGGGSPRTTGPNGQAVQLSDHDMEMLRVFHAMPVEKQLALLSLFK
jgi:hypothetical protein